MANHACLSPSTPDTDTQVFRAILRGVEKESGFDYPRCAKLTEGYTPSDITALCKAAVAIPARELRRAQARRSRRQLEGKEKTTDSINANKLKSSGDSATTTSKEGVTRSGHAHSKARSLRMTVS
jgi:SpoVK/Ycf46/Vps4 family AAA+-type ATPase